jgi:N-methylhydantoinase A/oxoprolinase/acetone carboxylase beta subunit
MYTVDVDTGGTFTDGLFSGEKSIVRVKVDTTPHDLTISFLDCLKEGAKKLGFKNLEELLQYVSVIRWSSTIASNVIAEKKGPKLGLIVSEDLRDEFLSSPSVGYLVQKDSVMSLSSPVKEEEILKKLKSLLEQGVRRICIAFNNSFYDNSEEIKVKAIVEEQYPEHYLGSVPVLLGSEIAKHPDSMTRVHYALLNAYVHGPMAVSLFKAEDVLRSLGYEKPLLIGHTSGGVARVSKTKPVETIESGPIFGIHASAYFSGVYGLSNALTLDVGGTTAKIGYVSEGKPGMTRNPEVFGIPLSIPLIDLKSIALGGGTVAKVEDGQLKLGPESMGAYPGPACYGIGGDAATLTDSFLLLGYLNPEYFAGGSRRLNVDLANKAIKKVADKLGVSVEDAAYRIAGLAFDMVAREVGMAGEYPLFAFGGNGGLFGCNVAERVGLNKVYVFSLGSVFSAFGSSVADVIHTYEHSAMLEVGEAAKLNEIVSRMYEEAVRDMEGEGLEIEKVSIKVELELENDGSVELTHPFSMEELVKLCREKVGDTARIEIVRLKASYPAPKPSLVTDPKAGDSPDQALKGEREIILNEGRVIAKIYDWDLLKPGNIVNGPAVIESIDSTYLIPDGWKLEVDEYLNGIVKVVR